MTFTQLQYAPSTKLSDAKCKYVSKYQFIVLSKGRKIYTVSNFQFQINMPKWFRFVEYTIVMFQNGSKTNQMLKITWFSCRYQGNKTIKVTKTIFKNEVLNQVKISKVHSMYASSKPNDKMDITVIACTIVGNCNSSYFSIWILSPIYLLQEWWKGFQSFCTKYKHNPNVSTVIAR